MSKRSYHGATSRSLVVGVVVLTVVVEVAVEVVVIVVVVEVVIVVVVCAWGGEWTDRWQEIDKTDVLRNREGWMDTGMKGQTCS